MLFAYTHNMKTLTSRLLVATIMAMGSTACVVDTDVDLGDEPLFQPA